MPDLVSEWCATCGDFTEHARAIGDEGEVLTCQKCRRYHVVAL